MHYDNKLYFFIIKMETYFHAKQNLLFFLKYLIPLF